MLDALIVVGWVLLGGAAAFGLVCVLPPLRRPLLTRPLLRRIRPQLPRISDTEQAALDAGTVWWDGELFTGRPDWRKLVGARPRALTDAERRYLDGPVEEICRLADDWQVSAVHKDLTPAIWAALKKSGTFGLLVPPAHGGLGFSMRAVSEAMHRFGSRNVPVTVTAILPNSLGPAELLHRYGTPAQQHHWLPRLATGEEIPCFALTEPGAGSDAANLSSSGVVERGRNGTLTIRLNWRKRYTTLSSVSTVIGMAFRLRDPEKLLGGAEDLGITVALVPGDTPGITRGALHDPLGVPFLNGPHEGHDVVVPLDDAIIGGRAQAGRGWKMLMDCLAAGRGMGLPAMTTGMAKAGCRFAGAYARVRRQFGVPVGRFEGVQEPLARMAGHTYVMDAARQLTVAAVDQGEKPAVVSAITKYLVTELGRQVVNDAMDVLAGAGINRGPRNPVAQAYAAAPIGITVEGANILTRSLIVFGQGAIRGHPFVLRELKAALDPDPERGLREFDRALAAHVRWSLATGARALWKGLTRGWLAAAPVGGPLADEWRMLSRFVPAFACAADVALVTLGGGLKRMEMLSGRFADALGWCYLVSAVLWRHEIEGRPPEMLPLVRWAARTGLHRIAEAMDGIVRNFPIRPVGWLLRRVLCPLGWGAPPPDDRLAQACARILLEPGPARDRLTAGIHLPTDPTQPLGRMEAALAKVVAAERVEGVLREAQKTGRLPADLRGPKLVAVAVERAVITTDDVAVLEAALAAREDAIQVDAFGETRTTGPSRAKAPSKRVKKR